MGKEKVRLIIDFKNKGAMVDWIEQIKAFQAINDKSNAYGMDVINMDENMIKQENTYIMATKENKKKVAMTSMNSRKDH
jgi:hypothetical protein